MKKQTIATFLLMMLGIFSIPAMAQVNTHSVWTNDNGYVIRDGETGCEYTSLASFNAATSFTESSPPLYASIAHFRGVSKAYGFVRPCLDHEYEFTLVKPISTIPDEITGYWDVLRDGTLMCDDCKGTAYGLSAPAGVGNYYKVYVDDPLYGAAAWAYVGYIDQRKDF